MPPCLKGTTGFRPKRRPGKNSRFDLVRPPGALPAPGGFFCFSRKCRKRELTPVFPVHSIGPVMSRKFIQAFVLAAFVLGLSGCGGRHADTARAGAVAEQTAAVMQVLLTMEKGLRQQDASTLAELWEPSLRDAARERAARAFSRVGEGKVDVTLDLAGLRTSEGRVFARVVWYGVRADMEAAGQMELEMTPGDPPLIQAIHGNNPVTGETTHPAGP